MKKYFIHDFEKKTTKELTPDQLAFGVKSYISINFLAWGFFNAYKRGNDYIIIDKYNPDTSYIINNKNSCDFSAGVLV